MNTKKMKTFNTTAQLRKQPRTYAKKKKKKKKKNDEHGRVDDVVAVVDNHHGNGASRLSVLDLACAVRRVF